MLYYIFRWLGTWGIPGSGMWSYISFRSLLAFIFALLISAWFGARFIRWMKRKGLSEMQRDIATDPYGVAKKGVPTMGGVIIIVSMLVPILLLGRLRNIYLLLMIVTTVGMGLLGYADDYIKTIRKNKDGLNGWIKIAGQFALGLVVGLTLYLSPDVVIRENVATMNSNGTEQVIHENTEQKSTVTTIPFFKNNNLDYSSIFAFCGAGSQAAGWIFFVIITILVVMAVSNGANLNDGMDGMAAGNSAIIGVALALLAYVSSHVGLAGYLNIMYIPHCEELVVFSAAFVGALIGFLWYNAYPAQIFMGDTGSLTIGGIIGVLALILHKELLLPLLCGIFFVESLSVILQTTYFKMGKRKGKVQRVFKRTPIHDAFRVLPSQMDPNCTYVFGNWPHRPFHEAKITARFWIVTMILAAATIITLKIR